MRAYQIAHAALGGQEGISEGVSEAVLAALTQVDVFMHRQEGRKPSHNPSRTHLTEAEAFQYLLWLELESREKQLEAEDSGNGRRVDDQTLLLRYVKCLVCNCIELASFKLVMGVSRLLYGFDWGNAEKIYSLVIQDVDNSKNQNVSNDWLRDLTFRLVARFGNYLPHETDGRGKVNFRFRPVSEPLKVLGSQILQLLTPWSSTHVFPNAPTKGNTKIKSLGGGLYIIGGERGVLGRNRRHAVIDPECFTGLATILELAPVADRLQLPYFSNAHPGGGNDPPKVDLTNPPIPPGSYYPKLINGLRGQRDRRKSFRTGLLHIKVDGRDAGVFDLGVTGTYLLRVGAGANLIQVLAREGGLETVLAVLSLRYNMGVDEDDWPWESGVKLGGGQRLIMRVSRVPEAVGDVPGFEVLIRYKEAALLGSIARRAWPSRITSFAGSVVSGVALHRRTAALALCLLFISTLGAVIYMYLPTDKTQEVRQDDRSPVVNPTPPAPAPSPSAEIVSAPPAGTNTNTEAHRDAVAGQPPGTQPQPSDGRPSPGSSGGIGGLGGYPPAVREEVMTAMKSRRILASTELKGVKDEDDITMSGSAESDLPVGYKAATPNGVVVRDDRPIFRWGPVGEASHYIVRVYDDQVSHDEPVAESPPVNVTEWTPTRPLPRGRLYSWQLKAPKSGAPKLPANTPSPEWKFRVLSGAALRKVEAAERVKPISRLAMGVVYANAGLLEEAEREFRLLVRSEPQNRTARDLLRSVQALRTGGPAARK